MKYSYNWLKEFIPKLPKPDRLAELIGRHAFEVEGLEKRENDTIFDIDVFSNRMSDAGGHIGFAREIAAFSKLDGKFPEPKPVKPFGRKFLNVKIAPRDLALRYYGALIENIKIQPSPRWLRDRLAALGVNAINNIVDVTNYVMLEFGYPLHAFDYAKIQGRQLTVRLSRAGESIETLDGETYSLPGGVTVIQDGKRIIDLAGIMGGANSAVGAKTKTIFLQAANFDPARIHRASAALKKRTDASVRYAAGLDPNAAETALALAVELIREIAGGIVVGVLDLYPHQSVPARILFRPEKANSVLGAAIPEKSMRAIFERSSFHAEEKKNGWLVTIPTARRDIAIEEDLIEEIGRMVGYDAIREECPSGELVLSATDASIAYRDRIFAAFRATGFDEIRTYAFIGDRDAALMDDETRQALVELENPQSREATVMRPMLLPSLARAAASALKFEKAAHFCELSRVFRLPARGNAKSFRDTPELEEYRLAFMMAEKTKKEGKVLFYELKGAADAAFEALGLPDVWYDDVPSSASDVLHGVAGFLHPYQSAEIKIGNTTVGILGTLHPDARRAFGVEGSASAGELYVDALEKELEREKEYRPIPKYPSALRDLAVLVPKNVRMTDVEDIIQNAGGKLLADADLFDSYEGDEIDNDKKNLAFHLIFQSEDRTLDDREVEALMKAIKKALEKNPDWEVR